MDYKKMLRRLRLRGSDGWESIERPRRSRQSDGRTWPTVDDWYIRRIFEGMFGMLNADRRYSVDNRQSEPTVETSLLKAFLGGVDS
eukprot:1021994-Prorocentrum_minimum.AAC.1